MNTKVEQQRNRQSTKDNTIFAEYYGACPKCRAADDCLQVGHKCYVLVCHEHKVMWGIEEQAFENDPNPDRNADQVREWYKEGYEWVEPFKPHLTEQQYNEAMGRVS